MWYRTWDDQPIGETEEEAFEAITENMDGHDLLSVMSESIGAYEILDWLMREHGDLFIEHFENEISQAERNFFEINTYEEDDEEKEED